MKKKVVLAFSGGLDTSYCLKYFISEGLDVHTICVNSGGFSEQEVQNIKKRALDFGAARHEIIDITDSFYKDCVRYLVYGNVLKNHTYPLSVSAERVFQAMAVADYAHEIKADFLAHGSTGAGNDQIRFDMIFQIRAPQIPILTPVRDQNLSREEEINFLKKNGVELDWEKVAYSINKGLWGTSVGGKETLTSNLTLPEEAYPTAASATEPTQLIIGFDNGEATSVNNNQLGSPVQVIREIDELASRYGIGRGIHVGDTIIGIKGRVGFEASAPLLLINAHETLEKHVLTRWQIYWKEQLANWYGMMLHEGQYLDPVMRDIESFLEQSQKRVTGKVHINLYPKRFEIQGIESPNDLMSSEFGQYGESFSQWSGEDVKGFAKILSVPVVLHNSFKKENK